MKTLSCDLCTYETTGETFGAWMKNLQPHYMEAHVDFVAEQMKTAKEEQQTNMQAWMKAQEERFNEVA